MEVLFGVPDDFEAWMALVRPAGLTEEFGCPNQKFIRYPLVKPPAV